MAKVCFIDLDGVLCDFVTPALALHGKSLPPKEVTWNFCSQIGFSGVDDARFWEPLGFDFWANLPWTSEGAELLAGVESIFGPGNVGLLSSPCKTLGCRDGKALWVERNIPAYSGRLLLGSAKHLAAAPCKLLLDDHDANCDRFRQAGGETYLIPRPWNRCSGLTDALGRFDVQAVLDDVRWLHADMEE